MFDWMKRSTQQLFAAQGNVRCPVNSRDVDIELCLECPALAQVGYSSAGTVTEIRCHRPMQYPAEAI